MLTERIVPGVRQARGFVPGNWSEPTTNGHAHSFIVFDDLSAAEAFAESARRNLGDRESHGVEGDELTVVELMTAATGRRRD